MNQFTQKSAKTCHEQPAYLLTIISVNIHPIRIHEDLLWENIVPSTSSLTHNRNERATLANGTTCQF